MNLINLNLLYMVKFIIEYLSQGKDLVLDPRVASVDCIVPLYGLDFYVVETGHNFCE